MAEDTDVEEFDIIRQRTNACACGALCEEILLLRQMYFGHSEQNGNGLSVSTGDLFPLVDIFVPDCLVCQGWYVLDILGKGPDSGSFGETWVYD